MRIWKLSGSTDESINLERYDEHKGIIDILRTGEPFEGNWKKLKVASIGHSDNSDSPDWISGIPVFTDHAVQILNDFLEGIVQILPLEHNSKKLNAINVTNLVDCLNVDRSVIRSAANGIIIQIKKYTFFQEPLLNQHIFKIPQQKSAPVFVSDQFRERVIETKLRGFEFTEVWNATDSHESRELRLAELLKKIEENKGAEFTYLQARELVEQGATVVSAQWSMCKNEHGEILIGQLQFDGNYSWMVPAFFPPIFHDLKWHVV
ncbi:imm11 family protein [Paenibacillus whitsoniae]|uniref:Immunity MXAN-0049 protein domain-containing protein n=1 Tax=Paenibacillus whitsoniae TaxID=2496558 RepID=A0A430J4S2_9BACL|nr:DUF1629 domain-containing protein [Paenibacillus whitsoniae]RTE02241.1 hypothetical protein EJQ19_29610 [Paenibacillus whitsoniae]